MWENRAGQAELIVIDASPAEIAPASSTALLRISTQSLGRSGGNLAEIEALRLRLADDSDNALSGSMADAVFSEIALWQDLDDSGTFDPGSDQLIGSSTIFVLDSNGEFDLILPDFDNGIGPVFRDYFLVLETTSDSDQQGVDAFRLTLLTEHSRMEDALYDSPLVLLNPEDVCTSIILLTFDPPIFANGFESQ